MAVCRYCSQEMLSHVSCTNSMVEYPDGQILLRVPHANGDGGDAHCHDCGTQVRGFHHPGCDGERCPRCGGQLIGCGCLSPAEEPALEALAKNIPEG